MPPPVATQDPVGDYPVCQDACCQNSCCDCGPCCCPLADLGDPWLLSDLCFFKCRGINTGGYAAQSFVWNPYQPADRFNGPLTWTDRANDYQFNELYFYLGKAAANDGCGWDFGYRIDALYGTNYRWDTSAGFETHWGNGQFYGLAVPAAYVEAAYNDMTVKVGRFISPVGYFTIGQGNNFFPYLPYTYQYGEPFTHTGVWAQQKVSDDLVVGGAITHGWDSTDNTGNPHAGGLVNATWTIDEQRALAYVGVFGPEPNATGVNPSSHPSILGGPNVGYTNRYLQTLVYTNKLSDNELFVLQSDFGTQHDARFAGQSAKWYGLNGFYFWNMTCRCQWGLNAEWFRDQGGYRVGQVLPSFGSPNARGYARSNFDGSFYRLGFGPKYYFTPNIYGRAALVADWYDGKRNPNGQLPFDDGLRGIQQAVIFDLVATF